MINIFQLPEEMRNAKRWLLWKSVLNAGKKSSKVPYYANGKSRSGKLDSPEDIANLATYSEALESFKSGRYAGMGFALGPDGNGGCWQGIDLDGLTSNPQLKELIPKLPGYVEWSPSGDGVHAIGYGRGIRSMGSNSSGVEFYCVSRYFTVTGNLIADGGITDLADFALQCLSPIHSSAASDLSAEAGQGADQNRIKSQNLAPFSLPPTERLKDALQWVSSDGREIWMRVGMAMKHESNCEEMFQLWMDWSSASDKFDEEDCIRTWNSFTGDNPKPVTLGTVYELAKQGGWKADEEDLEAVFALSGNDYERQRRAIAKEKNLRLSYLDDKYKQAQKRENESTIDFESVVPWESPVDGATLLSDLTATILRFIVCHQDVAKTTALWIAMTWFMDVVQVAPMANITAPEKRCGKSLLLDLIGRLAYKPLTASNITPSALFRSIDLWGPTLLVDEADSFMGENEELRGIVNCGHTRSSAYVIRTVGEDHTPTRFNVWGAKALAGIGKRAGTIEDRSISLVLRRKLPSENVERLRHADPGTFADLASKLARFAEDNREAVRHARPTLSQQLNDRAQDNWEPLLAIAEVAGGDWPGMTRKAALVLSEDAANQSTIEIELLADIREVFNKNSNVRFSTVELITALCEDKEKPWATFNKGFPIKPRQVSQRLKGYGIISKNIRVEYGKVHKGYELDQFRDTFDRYLADQNNLAAAPPQECPLHATNANEPSFHADFGVAETAFDDSQNKPFATYTPAPILGCSVVADISPPLEIDFMGTFDKQ